MPRSHRVRILALMLFVLAGFAEPAWELTHALTHLQGQHDQGLQAVPVIRGEGSSLAALGHDHGHAHLPHEPALRPPAGLFALGAALPPSPLRFFLPMPFTIRVTPPFALSIRAGPDPTTQPSRPRAPPTL